MGHRDAIPEDSLDFLRWSRNFLIQNIKNAKRWGISPTELEFLKFNYKISKEAYEECPKDPPPEPNPIDGFTIFWDKKKRFKELLCAFHGIEVDKNGSFDGEELLRRMRASSRDEHFRQWKEFLMGIVRENAARYNMSPEWVNTVRRRLDETQPKKRDGDDLQQILFMIYSCE
jgi:hypothetical protein